RVRRAAERLCRSLLQPAPRSAPCPYTPLFRSGLLDGVREQHGAKTEPGEVRVEAGDVHVGAAPVQEAVVDGGRLITEAERVQPQDRKSTRLNSSHVKISYAVFCLKKKTRKDDT